MMWGLGYRARLYSIDPTMPGASQNFRFVSAEMYGRSSRWSNPWRP